jgi:PAS domain S-box-containing protein
MQSNNISWGREAALAAVSETDSVLLEQPPAVALLVDVEGAIQEVDAGAHAMLGYAPGDLLDTSLFRHIYERDLLPVFRGVAALVLGHEKEVELGFHIRTAGGLWRGVRASMQARCQGAAVVGILLTIHPVLTALA